MATHELRWWAGDETADPVAHIPGIREDDEIVRASRLACGDRLQDCMDAVSRLFRPTEESRDHTPREKFSSIVAHVAALRDSGVPLAHAVVLVNPKELDEMLLAHDAARLEVHAAHAGRIPLMPDPDRLYGVPLLVLAPSA